MKRQTYGKIARREGFTLVEVLVASALTSFLFLAVFGSLVFCRKAVAGIRLRAAAECLAADKMDELFNRPLLWFDDIPASGVVQSWDLVPATLRRAYFGSAAYGADAGDDSASFSIPDDVRLFYSVIPTGNPAEYWTITVDAAWDMDSGGVSGRLASPLVMRRYRVKRATFREKQP